MLMTLAIFLPIPAPWIIISSPVNYTCHLLLQEGITRFCYLLPLVLKHRYCIKFPFFRFPFHRHKMFTSSWNVFPAPAAAQSLRLCLVDNLEHQPITRCDNNRHSFRFVIATPNLWWMWQNFQLLPHLLALVLSLSLSGGFRWKSSS